MTQQHTDSATTLQCGRLYCVARVENLHWIPQAADNVPTLMVVPRGSILKIIEEFDVMFFVAEVTDAFGRPNPGSRGLVPRSLASELIPFFHRKRHR